MIEQARATQEFGFVQADAPAVAASGGSFTLTIEAGAAPQRLIPSGMMGLGYALTEEVRFEDGEILHRNFDTYQIPRFSWLPRIETILIENPEVPASGCGEPPIVNMGAVVANAIYDAVGARLRQLPMTPARIQQALKRG